MVQYTHKTPERVKEISTPERVTFANHASPLERPVTATSNLKSSLRSATNSVDRLPLSQQSVAEKLGTWRERARLITE